MVIAELPLWVAHSGGTSTPKANGGNPASHSSKPRHEESLSLLLARQTKTAIYSIDSSPTANIFATAGGDGAIRIWNAGALFPSPKNHTAAQFKEETGAYVSSSGGSSADEDSSDTGDDENPSGPIEPVHDLTAIARRKDGSTLTDGVGTSNVVAPTNSSPSKTTKKQKNRLLCTLTAHTGSSVLCVRFSHSGDLLASAGDDACVCIYARRQSDNMQWSRTKLCRGHGLDVVDLAWAPDDSYLVSCSLDSATPIIVWKPKTASSSSSSSMICNPFKILGEKIHTSTVKGVTFDPAGSYVASSGDDPAVCIWRAHDDWGLEARIDSGIFRQWKDEDSMTQSLFRRISWATDGSFICTTNAVVKNKHVASTISREKWAIASSGSASGAASLVGHTQPVVVSRHSPSLLNVRKEKSTEDDKSSDSESENAAGDGHPDYATLLALGDRKGFITIWTTNKTRPIFKLQCSESHCTVTDLSWGMLKNGDLMLLVALLDGQIVALRFSVPDEIGPLLSTREKSRVFQLRYGIDTDLDYFVGQSSGPRLIENTLQLTLEEHKDEPEDDDPMHIDSPDPASNSDPVNALVARSIKDQQKESRSQGKKRVQPVLMQFKPSPQKRPKATPEKAVEPKDPIQQAKEAAERTRKQPAASAADTEPKRPAEPESTPPPPAARAVAPTRDGPQTILPAVPHSKERLYSVDLPVRSPHPSQSTSLLFECCNVTKTPAGSKGGAMACIEASVKFDGKSAWKETIPGSSCCALAASSRLLAIGTTDGSVLLYATSPTIGWTSRFCFRSHPPFIIGHPVVALQLQEDEPAVSSDYENTIKMLVIGADGYFAVYSLVPDCRLCYKGSIIPAISHMGLCSSANQYPELSRAFLLNDDSVAIILSFLQKDSGSNDNAGPSECGPGGAIQAFVYLQKMETWARASDSRFVLSDFYSTLPPSREAEIGTSSAVLSRMDEAVRFGSMHSSLKGTHRARLGDRRANLVYSQLDDENGNFLATRSHCEDRMACAFALNSSTEFKKWFNLYLRVLVAGNRETELRHLVDILLSRESNLNGERLAVGPWWMGSASSILNLSKKELAQKLLVEAGKNRGLQRLANEIAMQLETRDGSS